MDGFLSDRLLSADSLLDSVLAASAAAGLPPIQVSPCQGKLLQILAQVQGARKILEIGTLGGYSTIWLARALPIDGRLITLEVNPEHAKVAASNISRVNLSNLVQLRVGPALDSLAALTAERAGPFDLVFIDADKETTPEYFERALMLCRLGSLIIVDNVIRKGALLDEKSSDSAVQGMRRFLHLLSSETRVTSTAIQTVGSKGYDGFAIARVTGGVESPS
jgi:predicted O-methyltransferase YrrM